MGDAVSRRNRSSEEFEMRGKIETWGRKRWPDARLVHELMVRERRIDMAFISPNGIVGVEIKSSKDVLTRAADQVRVFANHLQTVIVAVAPKWKDGKHGYLPSFSGAETIECGETVVATYLRAKTNRFITTAMLHMLWADEARRIASRTRVSHLKSTPLYTVLPDLARALTGDEIVREVCRELRARDAFPKSNDHPASDAPIKEPTP